MTAQPPTPGAHVSQPTSRAMKIVLWIVGILIAIPIILVILIATFDWNRIKPWLNNKVSESIERPFAINGNLAVHWERPATSMPRSERHWRDYIPWPHLYADDVHVGNPAGLPQRDMANVRQFSFSLDPFALLGHRIHVPVLRFDGPSAELLRTDATHYNWAFKHDDKKSKWTLDLDRVVLTKGTLHVLDAVTKADVTADIETISNDARYGIAWTLRGEYNGAPVGGGGKAGAVLSLADTDSDTPFPVEADMHSANTRIAVAGTITRPAHFAGLDLQLKLAAPSMARLYPFTGVLLPETPPFSTAGHLTGELGDNGRWIYDKFTGKVGESDIAGRFEFETKKPRNKLSGNLVSHQLRFADLGPLIGADSNASKKARGVADVQPEGKALPVEKFHTERWKALDADVRFSADRIVRDNDLPISKLQTHVVMNDGVLSLNPLNFVLAGGNVTSTIKLDGSNANDKIKATADITARRIQIKQLFPKIEKMQATVGEVYAEAKLTAAGDSVGAMLADANGQVKGLVSQGKVSKLLLEEAGLNVGNVIITKLFGDKEVQLNCLAADLGVKSGVARTNMFILDTDEAIVDINGTVSLASEQMDLRVKPETKALRLFTLRTPFYVRGTFKKPDLQLDKKVLAMKGGAAAALAVIAAPVAALIPLINTGPGKDSPCNALLAQASAKPVAPPPPKRAK